jgi:hypothetical protein
MIASQLVIGYMNPDRGFTSTYLYRTTSSLVENNGSVPDNLEH